MELIVSVFTLVIGSIVTWAVSKWYYRRNKDDFSILLSKLDKIAMKDLGQPPDNVEYPSNKVDHKDSKDPEYMDTIENAIQEYVHSSGLDRGYPEHGLPIHEIEYVIRRLDKIRTSLDSYKHRRIAMGA